MTDAAAAPAPASARAARLWAELVALYVGLPLTLALVLEPSALWTVVFGAFGLGLGLLAVTPGFAWRELREGPLVGDWRLLAGFTAVTAALAGGAALWLAPGAFLGLATHRTGLWLTILALYPILSALPQEILYRVLFFRRYGGLFARREVAVAVNAGLFGLAHLFLWNWVAVAATTVGGALFALAYLGTGRGRNLLFAVLLHAIAGWILFTAGLGTFFYHGAVR